MATLILGMAFVTEEYSNQVLSKKTGNTNSVITNAPSRDRARLCELQKHEEFQNIVTLNFAQSAEDTEPGKHINGTFSSRTVRYHFKSFFSSTKEIEKAEKNKKNLPKLTTIMTDYFRFPSEYMIQAYTPFLVEMVPELYKSNYLSTQTNIYLPNYKELIEGVIQTNSFLKEHFVIQFIKAEEYPLYKCTESIDPIYLGGYSNSEQIKQLDSTFPFLILKLKK